VASPIQIVPVIWDCGCAQVSVWSKASTAPVQNIIPTVQTKTKFICSYIRKWTHKKKIVRHRVCLCVSSQEVFNRFWWSLEVFLFARHEGVWLSGGCNFTPYHRQQVEVAYELYAAAALYPDERAPVIILMGLHEFQSRSGRFTEKKNLLSLLRSVSRRVKLW
jgi:hypothetical protein